MNFKGPTSATDSTQKVWTDMIVCNTTSNQTLTSINTFTHTGSAQPLNEEGMSPVAYKYTEGTGSYINTGSWDRISGASVIIENNLTYGSELILSGLGVGGDIIFLCPCDPGRAHTEAALPGVGDYKRSILSCFHINLRYTAE